MTTRQSILFTAFEPSGDALAAPVIERLRTQRPDLDIWAMGGPKMRSAGAQLLEVTTQRATMLLGSASQLWIHRRRLRDLARWLVDHPLSVLVPVDSPAANWSICKLIRRNQRTAKIVHLAAPQLWAWAPWRIGKLRRLTDQVLCLLPFEPAWFNPRGVPAMFVGHPIFDRLPDARTLSQTVPDLPSDGEPRIALLPGSRPGEIRANWRTMMQAFMILQRGHPHARGLVATANPSATDLVRRTAEPCLGQGGWPDRLEIKTGQTEAVLHWADIVLVVSGTATLQTAAHHKPMVVLYNISRWAWHLWGRWLVQTRTFSLPNLVVQADGHRGVVPELVPHFGRPQPVAEELERLIRDRDARQQQRLAFDRIADRFASPIFSDTCSEKLLQAL